MSAAHDVAVWGVGTSPYGKQPHRRVEALAWEAIAEAVADAGITPADIDAFIVGSVFGPPGIATRVQRGLGLPGVPMWCVEAACASGTAAYHQAVEAVRDGRYGCVLVLGVDQMSTLFSGAIVPEATDPEGAAGLPLPGLYALQAQRYAAVHGVTPEQLAAVAVKNKRNGLDNPRAQLNDAAPSIEEVLASRMIVEPLTFLQCCPTTDGAGAVVIGRPRGARHRDVLVRSSAFVSGAVWDQRNEHVWGFESIVRAAEPAFADAGITATDIDVLEVHDAFTIGEVITLEALGLVPVGKGAELAVSGHTARDGAQPVNPSGGLLSRGHPLGGTGPAQIAEIVWQLRGEAGPRKVQRHRIGVVETMGGGAPALESAHMEGQVRHATFAGGGGDAREEIVALDDDARTYTCRYLDGPLDLASYTSTIRVEPDGDGSQVTWNAEFAAGDPAAEPALAEAIAGIYASGLAELARRFDG